MRSFRQVMVPEARASCKQERSVRARADAGKKCASLSAYLPESTT